MVVMGCGEHRGAAGSLQVSRRLWGRGTLGKLEVHVRAGGDRGK